MDRSTWSDDDDSLLLHNDTPVIVADVSTPRRFVSRVHAKHVELHEADVVSRLSEDLFNTIVHDDKSPDDTAIHTVLRSVYGIDFSPQTVEKLQTVLAEGREVLTTTGGDVTGPCRTFVVNVLTEVADQKLDIPLVLQDSVMVMNNTPDDSDRTENTRMRIPILSQINDRVMRSYIDLTAQVVNNKEQWRSMQTIDPYTIVQFRHVFIEYRIQVQSLPDIEVPDDFLQAFIEVQKWGGALLRCPQIAEYPEIKLSQDQVKLDLLEADKAFKKFRNRVAGSYASNYAPFGVGILALLGVGGGIMSYPGKDTCPTNQSSLLQETEQLIQSHGMVCRTAENMNGLLKYYKHTAQCFEGHLKTNNSTELQEFLPRLQNATEAVKDMLAVAHMFHEVESELSARMSNIQSVTSLQGVSDAMQSIANATALVRPLEQYSEQGYNYTQVHNTTTEFTARTHQSIIKFIGNKTSQFQQEVSANPVGAAPFNKIELMLDSLAEHILILRAFDCTEMEHTHQQLLESVQQRKLTDEQTIREAMDALSREGDAPRFKTESEILKLQKMAELVDSPVREAEGVRARAIKELADDTHAQLETLDLRNRITTLKSTGFPKEAAQAVEKYMLEQYNDLSQHAKACMKSVMGDLNKFVNRDVERNPRYVKASANSLSVRGTMTKQGYSELWYTRVYQLISNDQLIALAVEDEIKIADSERSNADQSDASNSHAAIVTVLAEKGSEALVAACYIKFGDIKAQFKNRGVVLPTSQMHFEELVQKCSHQLQKDYATGLQPLIEMVNLTQEISRGKHLRAEAEKLLDTTWYSFTRIPLAEIVLGGVFTGVMGALLKYYRRP